VAAGPEAGTLYDEGRAVDVKRLRAKNNEPAIHYRMPGIIRAFTLVALTVICLFACGDSRKSEKIAGQPLPEYLASTDDYVELLLKARDYRSQGRSKNDPDIYKTAIPYLEKAIEMQPDRLDAYQELAEVYESLDPFYLEDEDRAGRFRKAIEIYDQAREKVGDFPDYYRSVAQNLIALERNAKAEECLKVGLKNYPHETGAYVELGYCQYNQGKFTEALESYRKYLSTRQGEEPDMSSIRGREHVGKTLASLGRFSESKKELEKAAKDFSEMIDKNGADNFWGCPFQSLGVLYNTVGEVSKAHEYCLKSAELQTNKFYVQSSAAVLAYRDGDFEKALYFVERAIRARDKTGYHFLKGFILIALQRYDEAKVIFGESGPDDDLGALATAKSILPGSFPWTMVCWVGRGHLALAEKDNKSATKYFRRFLDAATTKIVAKLILIVQSIDEANDSSQGFESIQDECEEQNIMRFVIKAACLGMGWLHSNQNQHQEAIEYFDKVLAFGNNDLLAMISRANAYAGLGRFSDAEKAYEEILSMYPNNKHALAELGIVKFRLGNMDEARENFQKSLSIDDKNYTCPYEGLGMLYLTQGDNEKAKDNFERAIAINPEIEYKKYNGLAKILIEEGKIEQARKLLEKSTQNYPFDDEAAKMLESIR
jgi:tetratricopeptide (TPR) repeat protein